MGWILATGGSASLPMPPPDLAMSPSSEPARSASTWISALPFLNLAQELGESGLPAPETSHPSGYSQANRPEGEGYSLNAVGAGTAPPQPDATRSPVTTQVAIASRPSNDRWGINLSSTIRGASARRKGAEGLSPGDRRFA